MFSFIRKQSLPHQLSFETLIAVVFVMTLLIYFISGYFTSEVNDVAHENQTKQIQLVSKTLSSNYEAMAEHNQVIAKMFAAEMSGIKLSGSQFLTSTGISVPELIVESNILKTDDERLRYFSRKSNHLVRVYVKKGNAFVNVASSMKGEEKSITDLTITSEHKAYSRLIAGRSYQGQAQVLGQNLYQNLMPIRPAGEVIAVLETSTQLEYLMLGLSSYIKQLSFGKSGYAYVVAAGENEGLLMIHKTLSGQNIYDIQPEFKDTFKPVFTEKQGSVSYSIPV